MENKSLLKISPKESTSLCEFYRVAIITDLTRSKLATHRWILVYGVIGILAFLISILLSYISSDWSIFVQTALILLLVVQRVIRLCRDYVSRCNEIIAYNLGAVNVFPCICVGTDEDSRIFKYLPEGKATAALVRCEWFSAGKNKYNYGNPALCIETVYERVKVCKAYILESKE